MHVVEEPERDAAPVRAVLGTVNVVVPEFCVGHEDVDRVFRGVIVKILGEGDLAQYEARAGVFPAGEGDLVPLGTECRVDRVGEVGQRELVLVRVAYRDVKVRVSVLVAVLEAHVGENRALFGGVVHVDALVEPGLLRAESGLRVFADVDGAVGVLVFEGKFADFNAVDFFTGCLRAVRLGGRVCGTAVRFQRNLEYRSVEPRPAKVRNAVQVLARDHREVLPEGFGRHFLAFDERSEGIPLCGVLFGNFLFPGFVQFLFADADDLLECGVERYAVETRKFRPDFWDGVFAVVFRDVAYEGETLRVGAEFRKQGIVGEVVHVFERE